MGFVGVYRALYDYAPQAAGELAISDGDLLYVLNKSNDDGWWKAKKKAGADEEDEPEGLIPNNYIEEAQSLGRARALYEYTRQTDEELSFPEDATLDIYDISDPDWILVGLEDEYGFVPSNYIDMDAEDDHSTAAASLTPAVLPPSLPARPQHASQSPPDFPVAASSPTATGPAAALASVMAGRTTSPTQPNSPSPPPQRTRQASDLNYDDYHHASDEDMPTARSPTLPSRPRPPQPTRPPYEYVDAQPIREETYEEADAYRTPGGFHMYNINEMVSVMGKRKKMPTTLGINVRAGTILVAPEKASDGPSMEWTADRMTHYSREGKHVFMELVRPSKSIDFHAGAKDTAEEIVSMLGEMAGALRAEGLREVIMAGTRQSLRKGQILYDFMAQSEDEVTVAAGDEVIIIDDSKSEEWWQVRRLKTGKEGVVPSSYVEITGTMSPGTDSSGAKTTVEQNRIDEMRLTKEALRASKDQDQVGPGMRLPERGSSLSANENGSNSTKQNNRRENGRGDHSRSKAKPDSSKVRTWTDRSKSFSVDAQFLGLKDGKIHLHKMNGVKIAVPITKMSKEDLEHVESATGISLADEKPLSDSRKSRSSSNRAPASGSGVSVDKNQKPEYDWFQFFLSCDVAVGLCERYAQAFSKDSMDESVLPDVNANVLRTLGLREGDIIKVMRYLDAKHGRDKQKDGDGGLFSGPGGALRNNTRKGRPAPAVQTSDIVDASAFSAKKDRTGSSDGGRSPLPSSPVKPSRDEKPSGGDGFDDDAWDVKPSKQSAPTQTKPHSPTPANAPQSLPAPAQALTGSMAELSLLSQPLQPTKAAITPSSISTAGTATSSSPTNAASAPQLMPGATPAFFSTVAQQRQRPQVPQQTSPLQSGLAPPPLSRPLSAPQSAQPSAFPTPSLVPQMTGVQGQPAALGTSMNEMAQARMLQQQLYLAQMQQPMMTGYPANQTQNLASYQTGIPNQFMQPMMTGGAPMPGQGPFADPGRHSSFSQMQPQPTGFQQPFVPQQTGFGQPAHTGVNSFLPPALEPQRTGMPVMQAQQTGIGGFGLASPPLPPQQQQQQTMQPLVPQQTGPPPPVRFGVSQEVKKLAPQATGRRANLSQATPQNPFGF